MSKVIRQKIKNQKWLSFSLVLGIMLLVAVTSCQPLFQNGCQNRLLATMFRDDLTEKNQYPAMMKYAGICETTERLNVEQIEQNISDITDQWKSVLPEWSPVGEQLKIAFNGKFGHSNYSFCSSDMNIVYMPDFPDHIEILKGTDFTAPLADGAIPCVVSQATLDYLELAVGETIFFEYFTDQNENGISLRVVGVFKEKNAEDLYWYTAPNEMYRDLFVSREVCDELIQKMVYQKFDYEYTVLPDYTKMRDTKIRSYLNAFRKMDEDKRFNYSFRHIVEAYYAKSGMINVMLWVLEIPIIGMMFAFLYMVSDQIVYSGRSEIAALKSRGFYNRQILSMYFQEYAVLGAAAFLFGLPLGYGLCQLAACTTDFCTFGPLQAFDYGFVPQMMLYGLAVTVIAVLFVLLPVFKYTKMSIVEYKATNNQFGGKVFWKRYCLDFAALGLSIYFLYTFNQNQESIRVKALTGAKIDPFIFLNVCLFIVASGFVIFRLIHYLVQFIYKVGRKHWRPVSYAAFLQITRTFKNQTFISVFIILTVAFGMFDANVARTINKNSEDRIVYTNGSDIQFSERWSTKNYMDGGTIKFRYIEPDFLKYQQAVNDGYLESVTRVLTYRDITVRGDNLSAGGFMIRGIETKGFGESTYLKEELYGDEHWFHTLNKLASTKDGIVISDNIADRLGLKVGDRIIANNERIRGLPYKTLQGIVVDIVDAWPAYNRFEYYNGGEYEQGLVLVNYRFLVDQFGVNPYEVWAKTAPDKTASQVYEYLTDEMGVNITAFHSEQKDLEDRSKSPEVKIINGMFTLDFLVALILCGVGFLIYWMISIKQRELLLGSYRAMGLSVRSINRMLIYEHFFSTFLTLLGGVISGMLATVLFIKLFGVVYLPEKSILEITLYVDSADILKLFGLVSAMILFCLFILRRQIKKMNITQALKLGED